MQAVRSATQNTRFKWTIRIVLVLFALVLIAPVTYQVVTAGTCTASRQTASDLNIVSDTMTHPLESVVSFSESSIEISADSLGIVLIEDEVSAPYPKPSVLLSRDTTVEFSVDVPADGEYFFALDYVVTEASIIAEGQLEIDGEVASAGFERFSFPQFFRSVSNTFPQDRYGNDALISQVRDLRWSTTTAQDLNSSQPYPLRLSLEAGEHTFAFTLTLGEIYLGSMYLVPFEPYVDYDAYHVSQSALAVTDFSLVLEAELPTYKNDTAVRPDNNRGLTVTPYDTYCFLMNMIGGESWQNSGTAAYYAVDVPEDGLYSITLRSLQNTRSNFTVFRRITVNGVVPFAQLNAVPFTFSPDWQNVPLGGDTPYQIFLTAGRNIIGIEATNAPYTPAIETIQIALDDINALALEINRLTGNQRDPFREWVIADYIPDIHERLNAIAQNLIEDKSILLEIDPSGASPELMTYQMAIDNILFLAEDPNKMPTNMGRFSEGAGSAAQLLGSLMTLLQTQPLALDKIYIHAPDVVIESPSVSFTMALGEDLKRFLYTFRPDPYQTIIAEVYELEVWVNRPRQYVNLLQAMTDAYFTPQTGISVKFSIMPDESRLILANAAGIQPDVALGVSTDRPYELAVRNALYDLRTFPDFDSFIDVFSPGALLGYVINDSVYALPETQDFWVTFYREDILSALNIPVPDTWDEVIQILPELQRYGMNYNTPLSSGSGQRGYLMTAPYLFNYEAPLYGDGGFTTGLQSDAAVEAIRFMADSFTIYGMPLSTVNFYQDFRYGTLPIGISNAETYIKLMTAAPEINGLWNLALYPATVLPNGNENRYTTGSAQTSIIFQNTDQPEEAWEFVKWWLSTETQVEFQDQLILNYGGVYLWFSANLEALAYLDIPEQHRMVIAEQWQWIQEPVRLPGWYMQERELSNIWNRIVFNGMAPRVAIDYSESIINREITRKMEEFGYIVDGVRVREFVIPTIETINGWIENAN